MNHIDYFKLQAKNLFKDFKTRQYNKSNKCYEYTPEFLDIGGLFFSLEIPDDKYNFSVMSANFFGFLICYCDKTYKVIYFSIMHRKLI